MLCMTMQSVQKHSTPIPIVTMFPATIPALMNAKGYARTPAPRAAFTRASDPVMAGPSMQPGGSLSPSSRSDPRGGLISSEPSNTSVLSRPPLCCMIPKLVRVPDLSSFLQSNLFLGSSAPHPSPTHKQLTIAPS